MPTSVYFTHDGLTLSANEWAARPEIAALGISAQHLRQRRCEGWTDLDALTTPPRAPKTPARTGPRPPPDAVRYLEDLDVRRFVLAHPDGASHAEIAEHLGIPETTVRELERRALERFARRAQLARLGLLLDRYEHALAAARRDVAELAADVESLAADLALELPPLMSAAANGEHAA